MIKLKLLTLCLWIVNKSFSQSVTIQNSLLCFDSITGSKIVNDLVNMEKTIVLQKDTIKQKNEFIVLQKEIIKQKTKKIWNRNFIIAGENILILALLGIFIYI